LCSGGGVGRIGRILGGESTDPGEVKLGESLPGVPGGGFAGNLTPNLLHDRLGDSGDVGGVMSPERSRELFPDAAGGDESKDVEY